MSGPRAKRLSHVVVAKFDGEGGFISVGGLPAGTYGVRFTSRRHVVEDMPNIRVPADGELRVRLATQGVITFYQVGH